MNLYKCISYKLDVKSENWLFLKGLFPIKGSELLEVENTCSEINFSIFHNSGINYISPLRHKSRNLFPVP